MDEILTPQETADFLKIKIQEFYRYINRKDNPLPSYKIAGKTIRVKKQDIIDWLASLAWNGEKLI